MTDIVLHRADLGVQIDPARLFGRNGPLVLEVGFGDGTFLAHLAKAHPDWNLLGAEVSLGSVARAFRRLRRRGVRHARLYRGDAQFLVRDVLPAGSLHRIYVNFPDPWPKKRHRDRRLLQVPFFRLAASRLENGGAILFTSDHQEYFAFALEQATASRCYAVKQTAPPPATLTTKYARKWQAQEKQIQHAVFTKIMTPDASFAPVIDTYDTMHHALFQGKLPEIDTFEKHVHPFDGGHVILLEAFRPVTGDGLLFVVRIEEPDLTQEILIEVRPSDGQYVATVKAWGQPLATRGTREAVGLVARWLRERGLDEVERFY
jgi:tRNA (guanine-N7-)-methyltransferase